MSGIVYGGSGVDWHSGLLQRSGADHVSVMDEGAGALDVSAGLAGWNGHRQLALGMAGSAARRAGRFGMVGTGNGGGTGYDPSPPVDCGGAENDAGGSERLMGWDLWTGIDRLIHRPYA